jgi:hypothetical protein
MNKREAVVSLARHVAGAVDAAEVSEAPFCHLTMANIFPADVYAEMLRCLPEAADYRALPGRSKNNVRDDGSSTRVKIDLLPEYIRHLSAQKREVWRLVGGALCSDVVRAAFVRQLAPGLKRRFGDGFAEVGLYASPVLMRDTVGYRIPPHTDTHWKGITVQIYLPEDERNAHIGTIMNAREADGSFSVARRMRFVPNSGYAFAVNDISWHSADPVGSEVKTRDSILMTYLVDAGLMRFMRNRVKRVGSLVGNEVRYLVG